LARPLGDGLSVVEVSTVSGSVGRLTLWAGEWQPALGLARRRRERESESETKGPFEAPADPIVTINQITSN